MSCVPALFLLLQVATADEVDRLYTEGRLQQALSAYRQLLAAEPRNPVLLAKVGACEYQLGAPEKALESLEAALAIDPALQPARLALGGALLVSRI